MSNPTAPGNESHRQDGQIARRFWADYRRWHKILAVVIIVMLFTAAGIIIYMSVTPRTEERFTEFYILGREGTASDFPTELSPGEGGSVRLAIVNREHETVVYHVEILADKEKQTSLGPITLNHGKKWEEQVTFNLYTAGPRQEVDFLLYRQGQSDVYRSLRLWVDVSY